jgi:NADPH:quinone reductase-like Zn-dependent oxidoreductase
VVGKDVTRFHAGDQVFASTLTENFGAYAEYKCIPEGGMVAHKPANMTYEEAAAVPIGATTALRLLRKGKTLESVRGQKVLIYGASGSVGTYAIQLAKYFGAQVTGVCSTANLGMVRSLGAGHVIDYTKQDIAASEEQYNIIFDTVAKFPRSKTSKVLAPNGVFVSMAKLDSKESIENLVFIKELIEAGEIKAVIDRCYPLEEMVAAHRYVTRDTRRAMSSSLWNRTMSSKPSPDGEADPQMIYQIRVKGHLGPQWLGWFEGLTITLDEEGDTLLTGPVTDQAALHGYLKKVRDLGMPLLSVNRVKPVPEDASLAKQNPIITR